MPKSKTEGDISLEQALADLRKGNNDGMTAGHRRISPSRELTDVPRSGKIPKRNQSGTYDDEENRNEQ